MHEIPNAEKTISPARFSYRCVITLTMSNTRGKARIITGTLDRIRNHTA